MAKVTTIEIPIEILKTFKEALEEVCMKYDFRMGPRPESFYEGKAIFDFYRELITRGLITEKDSSNINTMTKEDWIKKATYKEVEEIKGDTK